MPTWSVCGVREQDIVGARIRNRAMLHTRALREVLPHIQRGGCSLRVTASQAPIHPVTNYQQTRGVVIVKRKLPVNVKRHPRLKFKPFLEDHWLYEFVEDTQHKAKKSVNVILLEDVPGVGLKNDIVAVKKGLLRNKLIPEGLADYASPDNLKERALRLQDEAAGPKRLSLLAQETMEHIQLKPLRVELHEDLEWDVLPKEPVLLAFRKDGVLVPDHALTLPEDPITDFGTYEISVTINGIKTIPVEMKVVKIEREDRDDAVDS